MKKLLVIVLMFALLMISATGLTEIKYTFDDFPEIEINESDDSFVWAVRVNPSWGAIYRDGILHTFVSASHGMYNIADIILTDGEYFIHADFKVIGFAVYDVTFRSPDLQHLSAGNSIYMLFFYTK